MLEPKTHKITRLLRELISGPFILLMIIPVILLDITAMLFQWICFPLYDIPIIKRAHHFQFERTQLSYLNPIRKFHCFYCSYFHGVLDLVREIAGNTERYWCPIKEKATRPLAHQQYEEFCEHNDEADYKQRAFELGQFKSEKD